MLLHVLVSATLNHRTHSPTLASGVEKKTIYLTSRLGGLNRSKNANGVGSDISVSISLDGSDPVTSASWRESVGVLPDNLEY